MARDTGSYTLSSPPVVDPALTLATAATSDNSTTLTYTTTGVHNLSAGQPVVITGFGTAAFNSHTFWDVSKNSGVGNPFVVAAVTGTNTFTVTATSVVATASVSSGTTYQSAKVSNSPYGPGSLSTTAAPQQWLPATAVTNVKIAKEWSNSFPIQPNDDRVAGVALATSAPSGNGAQVTYTVASGHGIVAGQVVTINGVVPNDYNLDTVTVAATGTTTVVINSPVRKPVTSYTNGAITLQLPKGGAQATVSSATGATGATRTLTYTTAFPHNLSASQIVSVTGASNANYNVLNSIVTTNTSTTFTVNAPAFNITTIATAAAAVTLTTKDAHGFIVGDLINVSGVTGGTVTAINVTSTAVTAITDNTITYSASSPVLTGATAYGIVVKNSGSFSGTADVIVGDTAWSGTYDYPSGNLNPSVDNHEIVANSRSGYPDFTPGIIVPNVVGLTLTNAAQKLLSAGLQQGSLKFSTDLSVTAVSTSATDVTYTTGTTNHNLSAGDLVNLTGGSVTTHNLGDVKVASVSGYTFTINVAGITGTVGTGLVARPKNSVVSAQTPSAGSSVNPNTTSLAVALTRNYGL